MEINNKKIIFELPGDLTLSDVADEILKKNNIIETPEDFFKYLGILEPKSLIIIDAAIVIAQKKISEEKLSELLSNHLYETPETAKRIIADIKEKFIPFARTIDQEKEKEKLKISFKENLPLGVKKIEISDVEKNAEELKQKRVTDIRSSSIGEELQRKGQDDKYREPIQ